MTQEEIIQAISDDKTMPFIQPEQLAEIVDFVIKNYNPFLDTLPEQPELKPKAIVIRPVVNLQKELMGVSAEVKDAVMLLLKEGWSLKAPDSEREFDQRAVCAGFSSIPPSYKLEVKKQPVEELDVTEFCKPIDPGIAQCVADHWWEMIGEESTNKKPVEGLEEEMEKFFETMPVLEHENIFEDTFQNIARHFAEWGAEHLKK